MWLNLTMETKKLENDINLAALGEQAHGVGKGVANFVFVSIGTGIGMGIVIDGQLYRGARGAAGEIGFLPLGEAELDSDEPPAKRRHGSLESVASADAVVASVASIEAPHAGASSRGSMLAPKHSTPAMHPASRPISARVKRCRARIGEPQ